MADILLSDLVLQATPILQASGDEFYIRLILPPNVTSATNINVRAYNVSVVFQSDGINLKFFVPTSSNSSNFDTSTGGFGGTASYTLQPGVATLIRVKLASSLTHPKIIAFLWSDSGANVFTGAHFVLVP